MNCVFQKLWQLPRTFNMMIIYFFEYHRKMPTYHILRTFLNHHRIFPSGWQGPTFKDKKGDYKKIRKKIVGT